MTESPLTGIYFSFMSESPLTGTYFSLMSESPLPGTYFSLMSESPLPGTYFSHLCQNPHSQGNISLIYVRIPTPREIFLSLMSESPLPGTYFSLMSESPLPGTYLSFIISESHVCVYKHWMTESPGYVLMVVSEFPEWPGKLYWLVHNIMLILPR